MRTVLFLGTLTIACLFCLALEARGKTFCVSTSAELHAALTEAVANNEHDFIRIVQGTYSGNFEYSGDENDANSIRVEGGYTTNCSSWAFDPSNTILEAGGSGVPLGVHQRGGGAVMVSGLTIQNGGYWGFWLRSLNPPGGSVGPIDIFNTIIRDTKGKGGVYIASEDDSTQTPGRIRLRSNMIVGNHGETFGGLFIFTQWVNNEGNNVELINNVIVGNIGSSVGGTKIDLSQNDNLYLANNTIVGNHSLESGVVNVGGVSVSNVLTNATLHFFNNIIRGNSSNSGVPDIKFYNYGSVREAYNNNYAELSGTWTDPRDNINADSLFVYPGFWNDNGTPADDSDDFWLDGDYHLTKGSPCIDTGTATGAPDTDIEGKPRPLGKGYDMGAYEFQGVAMPWILLLLGY